MSSNKDKTTELIGTDVDMKINVGEGYLIMGFDPEEAYAMDWEHVHPKYLFTFFKFYGIHWPEGKIPTTLEGMIEYAKENGPSLIATNELTYLLDLYKQNKEQIDRVCDCNHSFDTTAYTIYNLLHLASDIDTYLGIFH